MAFLTKGYDIMECSVGPIPHVIVEAIVEGVRYNVKFSKKEYDKIVDQVTAGDIRVFRTVRKQRGDQVTNKAVTTLERATEYFDKGARVVLCQKYKSRRKKNSTAPAVMVSRKCVSRADCETFFEGSSHVSRTRKSQEQLEWERRSKGTSLARADEIKQSQERDRQD